MAVWRHSFGPKTAWVPALLTLGACASHPPATPNPVAASFGDFTPPASHAHYLACPADYCLAKADEAVPILKVPAEKLRDLARRTLDAQSDLKLVNSASEGLRLSYQQAPSLFGTSGTATVEIVDVDEGESTLVVYSQSDAPGGNVADQRDRVHDWLKAIYATLR